MFKKYLARQEINTAFFATFLGFLLFLTVSHASWASYPPLFFLHAVLQNLAEVSLCLLAGCLFKRWWVWSLCFFLLLLHYADFLMVHVRGAGILFLFKFLLGQGLDHLVTSFSALNLNPIMAFVCASCIPVACLAGVFLYRLTARLSKIFPLQIVPAHAAAASLLLLSGVLIADYLSSRQIPSPLYESYTRALPWGKPLFTPQQDYYTLAEPPFQASPSLNGFTPLTHKPNIYVFVLESLRKDFVTPSIAPHLCAFGQEWGNPEQSFANANATAPAWFSLFYSSPAYQWTAEKKTAGAPTLRFLKDMGYQIRAYSSSDLKYFQMEQFLFGKDRDLLGAAEEYAQYRNLEPCDRDILALSTAKKDLLKCPHSTVFLFFLDATHSEYSVPKNWIGPFQPTIEKIDYLSIHPNSPELEGLKNRYRNAIFFLDAQLGSFIAHLKKQKLFEESIIAIMGDHGEEFFEQGALFHGSQLNTYQTSVPIFLKAGSWRIQASLATQMDLFPSIFHFLTNEIPSHFSGQSLFAPVRKSRIAVLDNGPHTPKEFLIEDGSNRLRARFTSDPKILEVVENSWDPEMALPFLTAPEQILSKQTAQSERR